MQIISIQVGKPIAIEYNGKAIFTGIFKDKVSGPIMLRTFNLDGDGQADLKVHGGRDKALYAYSLEAYSWWEAYRPGDTYLKGSFGENLTFESLPEDQIYINDVYTLGEAIVQVTQPRFPCYKLAAKFDDSSIIKTFMASEQPGVYFRVLKEGMLDVGDNLELTHREPGQKSVREVFLKKKK